MVLTQKLLLFVLWLPSVIAVVEQFEAFDRKVFKRKKQRYATFDEKGILTLDGTLNGKSNDIGFPNLENDFNQETCQKNPTLMFEICETQRLGAWTGLAICYESQLAQPYVNPFFRLDNGKKSRLVRVLCGPRQNAIFIQRETPIREPDGQLRVPEKKLKREPGVRRNKSKKFEPSFYSIHTSFATEKLYFQLISSPSEKRCALLQFGGNSLVNVNLTTLRREPLPEVYRESGEVKNGSRLLEKIDTQNHTLFNHKFPDLNNRKYKFSKDQGLWLLLVDFLPAYLQVQNISAYGWLPLRVKITGRAINPCYVEWVFLQSREVNGLTAAQLKLEYEVTTGTVSANQNTKSQSKTNQTSEEKTDKTSYNLGGNFPIPGTQGLASIGLNFGQSFVNSVGSSSSEGETDMQSIGMNMQSTKTRTETVTFQGFQGTIDIEQMHFVCHGQKIKIDRIRYRDPDGDDVMPSAVDAVDQDDDDDDDDNGGAGNIKLPAILEASCFDKHPSCRIWAASKECKKTPTFMLNQCKLSCKVCTVVSVESKNKDPYADKEKEYELPCTDLDANCPIWKDTGECHKDPFLLSKICRKSCDLCISRADFKKMRKEWRKNEGLDDYNYLYDEN